MKNNTAKTPYLRASLRAGGDGERCRYHDPNGRHPYVRQLRGIKLKPKVEVYNATIMAQFGEFCGWTLARAHVRSGESAMIGGYRGKRATCSIRRSPLSRSPMPTKRAGLRIPQEGGSKRQTGSDAGTVIAPLRNGTTIMRATERFGILVWLALLLALHVSAQSIQPTLKDTMTSIASTLNSRGIVSWTTTDRDLAGAKWTTTNSLAQVNADPSSCSITWTTIEMESNDKTVETYLVQLQAVSGVNVQSYSRSMASQSSDKLQFSPDTYLIQIKTTTAISGHQQSYKKGKLKSTAHLPNDHAADIQFADEQTATRVADAIRYAAGLCGATQSPL